jgi:DNA-binding response OmpR family regulator
MKVLIIDADWRFAGQAQGYLEAHAHLVVHQNSASSAAAQVDHWKPDLVILSAEFAQDKLIEAIQNCSPRPAVLLTDMMARYDRAWRAWQKCGDELLMKPLFKAKELQDAMVSALENAAAGSVMRHRKVAASA